MPRRRPRLPMMLGLALLTAIAHLLLGGLHVILHVLRGADQLALPLLLALAPLAAVALMLKGRPRHGATLLTLTMLAGAFHTLYSHHWLQTDTPNTAFYAGTVLMLLALELQGLSAGVMLMARPEGPRGAEAAG